MTALQLIQTVEILTQDQYEIVKAFDASLVSKYLNNIGPDWHTGVTRWLNTNVYSEAAKEERDFKMETGL